MIITVLTKRQKEKLIEMAIALFPDYKNIYWDAIIIFNKADNDSYIHFGRDEEHFRIHWFELVFRHLPSALQAIMTDKQAWRETPPYVGNVHRWEKGDVWTFYTAFHFHYPKAMMGGSSNPSNPIEYLYEEFKKITK